MTSDFTKNLWMVQEVLNSNLEAGCSEVRRKDFSLFLDPSADETFAAWREWETAGFIEIVEDPRIAKEKAVCLRLLKKIEMVPLPPDLND